ncbi:MAG TPA: LysE family translocator [Acidimicrobiales bacterium]|nr:LysE family translocator [Acidimicrobiales bacterium]
MVSLHRAVEFGGLAAAVIAVPGPSVMFTVSRALTCGRRTALLTVIGNEAGLLLQVVAVAFGVGVVVERSAQIFTVIKLFGACYLIYLGVQSVRNRGSLAKAVAAKGVVLPPKRALRDGAIVGATNPKSIAFFVVVLPGFTDRASGGVVLQLLLLGAIFPLVALVLDSIWALAAGGASQWLSRSPRRLAAIGGTAGLVMIGLGLTVAASGRKD